MATTRRRKTKSSPLGDKLRMFAAGYARTGQDERAAGLLQAAEAADVELASDPLVALRELVAVAGRQVERIGELVADLTSAALTLSDGQVAPRAPVVARELPAILDHGPRTPRARSSSTSAPKGERRLLIAIAQHPGGVTREQLTVLTGYKRSSRDTYLQRLRARGAVEETDRLRATSEGRAELGADFKPLPTGKALREHWLANLPEGERRILALLIEAGRPVTRDTLSDKTGYRRSSRDTYVQRLRARQLVEVLPAGNLVPSRTLYDVTARGAA